MSLLLLLFLLLHVCIPSCIFLITCPPWSVCGLGEERYYNGGARMLITKLIVNRVIGETMPDMMSPPWSVCGRGEERYCDGGARRLVTDLSVNHVTGESMPDTINYLRELGPLLTPDYPSGEGVSGLVKLLVLHHCLPDCEPRHACHFPVQRPEIQIGGAWSPMLFESHRTESQP